MKVLLINTPTKYSAYVTAGWDRTSDAIGAFPPIGLSYLAGYLLKYTNHHVEILDAMAERLNYEQLEERIKKAKPELVGISVFTPTFYDCLTTARLVKKNFSGCYVCVGGVQHLRMFLKETLSHSEIDFVVRGEGEEIFAHLLDALEKKVPLFGIRGVSFMKDDKVVSYGEEGYINDINSLPSPAFSLLPLERYKSAIGTGRMVGTIATSRGCPYQCTFCDHPYQTFRTYSTDRVVSEMEYFYGLGIKEFVFFDDMFNITPARTIEISEAIVKRFPDVIWSFRGRADQVTKDVAMKAKQAGCVQMMFGLEAADDEGLRYIKKRVTVKNFLDTVRLCRSFGIETSANYIIGLPTHRSRKDILDLIDFASRSGTDYAQFNILVPYVGTEIYKEGLKKGILPPDFWSNYVINPIPNAYIPLWNEYLNREELSELLQVCFRKFYFRPSRVLRNILRVKSISHFKMKLKGMFTVMGFGGFDRKKQRLLTNK